MKERSRAWRENGGQGRTGASKLRECFEVSALTWPRTIRSTAEKHDTDVIRVPLLVNTRHSGARHFLS